MREFPEYPTVPQAAKRLGVSRQTLYCVIASGELTAHRPGSRWLRVRWADCIAWIESKKVTPDSTAEAAYFARMDAKAGSPSVPSPSSP